MKKKLTCITLCTLLVLLMIPLPASASSFVSWSGNKITTDYAPTNIIVADDGTSYVTNNSKGIMKYLPNGTLDTSFGSAGKAMDSIRAIVLCFNPDGDILTGDADTTGGLIKIDHATGAASTVISGILIGGVAVDSTGNIYVNTGSKLIKYNSSYTKLWEKSTTSGNLEMGVCLLSDGSIITTSQALGNVYKYTSSGDSDTSFGTNGALKVSNNYIGFASYNGAIYVSCFQDGAVKMVSDDGKSFTTVFSGASPAILYAKHGYYFIPNFSNNRIEYFQIPGGESSQETFACTASPLHLNTGSTGSVTLAVTSNSVAAYQVTARLINKATGAALDASSTTATFANGCASVVLSAPSGGWPSGAYSVMIDISSTSGTYTISNSIDPGVTITVDNKLTSVTSGDSSVTGVGGTTFDPSTVLTINEVTQQLTPAQSSRYAAAISGVSSGHSLAVLYDIKLLLNGQPVSLNGGRVQVRIKLSSELAGYSDLQVVYIDDSGSVTVIPCTVSDGYITFETTHFSSYGIIGVPAAANPVTGDSRATLPLGLFCGLLVASAALAAGLRRIEKS